MQGKIIPSFGGTYEQESTAATGATEAPGTEETTDGGPGIPEDAPEATGPETPGEGQGDLLGKTDEEKAQQAIDGAKRAKDEQAPVERPAEVQSGDDLFANSGPPSLMRQRPFLPIHRSIINNHNENITLKYELIRAVIIVPWLGYY